MNKPTLRDKKGIVLVLVLSVVVLFTAMIAIFKSDQSVELELAYNFRDSFQSQYLGNAGIDAAIYFLAKDDNEYDSQDEEWGRFQEIMLMANANPKMEGNSIQGEGIVDECSKIDINSLVELSGDKYVKNDFRAAQLKRLMIDVLQIDIEDREAEDLIDSICDWIDMDKVQNSGGAEDEYYLGLDKPYYCKNGPMDSPEEILLVKDMKKEWYYGTETYKGIEKFITAGTNAMGKGKINLNTASKEVLMSLTSRIDDATAEKIIGDRPFKQQSDVTKSITNYDTLVENPQDGQKLQDMVDIKSTMFSVNVKGVTLSGATINTKAKLFIMDNLPPTVVYYKIY